MDFAWVVDALRRGLKVTREAWKQDPPVKYIYMFTGENGKRAIMMSVLSGSDSDFEWYPTAEQLLTVDDWEEYVGPKEAAPAKSMHEKLPVWPEVNADGYARQSKDSDVIIHDGVYRYKKEPAKNDADQQLHIGDKKPTFQDLCDDYLAQQKGKVQINELPFITTKELHGGEPVCESYPALKKVWTTFHDLDVRVTGTLIDQKDYPYTLCERDVIEQKGNKVVVLAEPGFSQRTVTLIFNENCWDDARSASAGLIHRLSTKYSWDMEIFISLLVCIQKVDGDYSKSCWNDCNKSLADQIMEDMEFWIRENAEVIHKLQYIINQYRNLVIGDAEEQKRRDILSRCEESMRQHSIVLKQLNKENTNQKED